MFSFRKPAQHLPADPPITQPAPTVDPARALRDKLALQRRRKRHKYVLSLVALIRHNPRLDGIDPTLKREIELLLETLCPTTPTNSKR